MGTPSLLMNSSPHTFRIDGFAITPSSRTTDSGHFTSSVSIRSGQGQSSHDRIYRFSALFTHEEAAIGHAMAQARQWLRDGRPA